MLVDNITQDLNSFTLHSRIFNGPFKINDYFNEKTDEFYIEKLEKIQNLRFPDDTCHNQKDNTYLIIGIILIIFAFILMIIV